MLLGDTFAHRRASVITTSSQAGTVHNARFSAGVADDGLRGLLDDDHTPNATARPSLRA
jgi:hypothetical protein